MYSLLYCNICYSVYPANGIDDENRINQFSKNAGSRTRTLQNLVLGSKKDWRPDKKIGPSKTRWQIILNTNEASITYHDCSGLGKRARNQKNTTTWKSRGVCLLSKQE